MSHGCRHLLEDKRCGDIFQDLKNFCSNLCQRVADAQCCQPDGNKTGMQEKRELSNVNLFFTLALWIAYRADVSFETKQV